MQGSIRLGRWLPLKAVQVHAPAGYVRAARTGLGPLAAGAPPGLGWAGLGWENLPP